MSFLNTFRTQAIATILKAQNWLQLTSGQTWLTCEAEPRVSSS